ncbi:conserved hypothetical protein [Agrobacterium fabrum str. J-07]|uniref:hypothetical protein n=1 Tax=Agrobacterium fabrum TaxID=1176649 RepID=UPI0009BC67C9|nr:hypothetical protein [Agrobacterium fabrum]CUX58492.1 conserved hypothetical protein [Agrobacterium fabrum str. J-07]
MEVLSQNEMSGTPDLGHRLRQLRWFRRAFAASVKALEGRYGFKVKLDDDVLAEVFVNWVEAIDHQKGLARLDRSDFITFSGGMMLRELIQRHPATVQLAHHTVHDIPEAAVFWPEGFLYTNFCISAVAAVHQQEFGGALKLTEYVDDLRTWWSFRENTQEMPSYAVAFLDRFVGAEPNWTMPERAASRAAMLDAAARKGLPELPYDLGTKHIL